VFLALGLLKGAPPLHIKYIGVEPQGRELRVLPSILLKSAEPLGSGYPVLGAAVPDLCYGIIYPGGRRRIPEGHLEGFHLFTDLLVEAVGEVCLGAFARPAAAHSAACDDCALLKGYGRILKLGLC
jgi:hypothetical protein